MRRDPVSSSSVASVGFDPETNELEIEFRGGDVYRYLVPRRVHRELMAADSVGRHFGASIRPRYRGWKVSKGN
jgi:KTSC domain